MVMAQQAVAQNDVDSSEEEHDIQSADFYRCRFYRSRMPEAGMLVLVETTDVKEIGAQVNLLEYGSIEGFIAMSHVTAKRVRSVQKHLKIGRREMMEVLRIDVAKMYIDLSKKSIMPDSRDEAE